MSVDGEERTIDMIRWTFTADPSKRDELANYLVDNGLEVLVRDEETLVAIWDEPEGDIGEVVEALWEINGAPFEIVHEEFQRENLLVYEPEEVEEFAEAEAPEDAADAA